MVTPIQNGKHVLPQWILPVGGVVIGAAIAWGVAGQRIAGLEKTVAAQQIQIEKNRERLDADTLRYMSMEEARESFKEIKGTLKEIQGDVKRNRNGR